MILYAFQIVMDWNWLWVVGELGATYGLFRWWKSTDTFLSNLEVIIKLKLLYFLNKIHLRQKKSLSLPNFIE